MTNRLTWGLQPPADTAAAWGARAIFHAPLLSRVQAHVELVHDRQDTFGEQTAVRRVTSWVSREGMVLLRRELAAMEVTPGECTRLELYQVTDQGTFHLHADPRGSHGYLYLVAWFDESRRAS